jgi:hypothetical protein
MTVRVDEPGYGNHFTGVEDTVEGPGWDLVGWSHIANPFPFDNQGAIVDDLILIVHSYH